MDRSVQTQANRHRSRRLYERDQYLYDDKVYFADGRCYVNTE